MPYGNHARGAKFTDASHKVTQKLENTINEMCLQIPGFFFGRMDVMYNSLQKMEKLFVVELNGAASEPTHIYDPKSSFLN
jgi:D-alanine-D-alanine ligase-like ATP-grasp enzyme